MSSRKELLTELWKSSHNQSIRRFYSFNNMYQKIFIDEPVDESKILIINDELCTKVFRDYDNEDFQISPIDQCFHTLDQIEEYMNSFRINIREIKILFWICDRIWLKCDSKDFNELISRLFPKLELWAFRHNYISFEKGYYNLDSIPQSIKFYYFLSDQSFIRGDTLDFTNTNIEEIILQLDSRNKPTQIVYSDTLKRIAISIMENPINFFSNLKNNPEWKSFTPRNGNYWAWQFGVYYYRE